MSQCLCPIACVPMPASYCLCPNACGPLPMSQCLCPIACVPMPVAHCLCPNACGPLTVSKCLCPIACVPKPVPLPMFQCLWPIACVPLPVSQCLCPVTYVFLLHLLQNVELEKHLANKAYSNSIDVSSNVPRLDYYLLLTEINLFYLQAERVHDSIPI